MIGGCSVARSHGVAYKWIALSNTTLGILMAAINSTSIIIALPAIFRGIHVDPLATGQTGLLLWVLMGFNVATTILLVSFGRLSDSYGRVRLYNLGFAVFTIGSILLSLTWGQGIAGEWQLIIFRVVQGIGGAFLFANSAAILTDAFPTNERGFALGLNQVAGIGGAVIGIVLGGLMAAINWRWVFLINVPFGLFGTIWAYLALKETRRQRSPLRLDWIGNITFAVGLLGILLGLTYSIQPYGSHPTGWQSPFVITSLIVGVALLVGFVVAEIFIKDPMFNMRLFKNQAFSAGNVAGLLAAVARGGLQFMLIIWLQGIWLPLHGVSFVNTPLQAGIDTLPQMVGFLVAGPISGRLSDRFGARWFGLAGMLVAAGGFFWLTTLHADFHYWVFAGAIFTLGAGMGLFAAPNSAAIMNSVPARYRGAASGMLSTFMNAGMMLSMGIFFTMVITGLNSKLPDALTRGLSAFHLPAHLVASIAHLPPIAALFAALLGYNPIQTILPAAVLHSLPAASSAALVSRVYFPTLIAKPFMSALRTVFIFSMVISLVAALASLLRGPQYIYNEEEEEEEEEEGESPKVKINGLQERYITVALVGIYASRQKMRTGSATPETREALAKSLSLLLMALDPHRFPKMSTSPIPKGGISAR
jgi:EmrB/QacA subfamily drug resistance transporter